MPTKTTNPTKLKLPVPRFEIIRGRGKAAKEFYWRFIARNGEELARASETYTRRRGVIRAIATISHSGAMVVDTTTKREG